MKLFISTLVLILSFSSFSQNLLNCHNTNIADSGYSFSVDIGNKGETNVSVHQMTIAGPLLENVFTVQNAYQINYSHFDTSSNACAMSMQTKEKTKFGYKELRLNLFADGFVGLSVRHYVRGYLLCNYYQENNYDIVCTPGGSEDFIIVNERVQTNKEFTSLTLKPYQNHSIVRCEKGEGFHHLSTHLNCEDLKQKFKTIEM